MGFRVKVLGGSALFDHERASVVEGVRVFAFGGRRLLMGKVGGAQRGTV